MNKMEKHFFAGGNTKNGFHNYFMNILSSDKNKCTYILKGGPGVGKSSMMKEFAKKMKHNGYEIEYVHCASDEDSLDAIHIPSLGFVMLDGTSPHVVDPVLPGVTDHILNLGRWLDSKKLLLQKQKIMDITREKSRLYKLAYAYMKSAGHLQEINNTLYEQATDHYKLTCLSENISKQILNKKQNHLGSKRCLFAQAFTANGFIDYAHTLYTGYRVWEILSNSMCATSDFLTTISTNALIYGYDVECYYFPTEPEKIQHLIIPALEIAFMSNPNYSDCSLQVNLNTVIDMEKMSAQKDLLDNNEALYQTLMSFASRTLQKTKEQHALLEHIYVDAMDFTKVDLLLSDLLNQYVKKEDGILWN